MRRTALMFHDVYKDNPNESGFTVDTSNLYKLNQSQFTEFLNRIETKCSKCNINIQDIIFTFDDGGQSFAWIAEELTKRSIKGHFFITTSLIDTKGFCTIDDLKHIKELGHTIGSHSHTHVDRICSLSYEEQIEEWAKSKAKLQKILDSSITEMSIPGGYFSASAIQIATKLGYNVIFTSQPTRKVDIINGVSIYGRFAVRQSSNTNKYVDFIDNHSIISIKTFTRYKVMQLGKRLLGRHFLSIREKIIRYLCHRKR